jgi:hypothetical protein
MANLFPGRAPQPPHAQMGKFYSPDRRLAPQQCIFAFGHQRVIHVAYLLETQKITKTYVRRMVQNRRAQQS